MVNTNIENSAVYTENVISAEQLKMLIGDELFNEISQYMAIQTHSLSAEHQVLECLRFLYLISAYPEKLSGLFIPVEQSIDNVWHYLILQTKEYRDFCETKLPGRFFIEHRSMPYDQYGQQPTREQMVEEALRWLPLYITTFGPFNHNSAPYWTMARFLREKMDMSLDQINDLAVEG